MPSSYTPNNGIEQPATGEQTGTWGQTVDTGLGLIDTALDGSISIALSGLTALLPVNNGAVSNGRNRVVTFTGSAGGTCVVTITPNTVKKVYFIINLSDSYVQMTQGSGSTVTIPPNDGAVVYCDGAGAGAGVKLANVVNTLLLASDNTAFGQLRIADSISSRLFQVTVPTVAQGTYTVAMQFAGAASALGIDGLVSVGNAEQPTNTLYVHDDNVGGHTQLQVKGNAADTSAQALLKLVSSSGTLLFQVMGDGSGIVESNLSLTDITTANSSTSKHGFLPKLPGGTSQYLRSDGTFAAIPAAGGGLAAANNLSDVANAATSRTNLGLATVAASGSAADLTGNLAVARLNGGSSASSTTFWRGDGTWATAGGSVAYKPAIDSATITAPASATITNYTGAGQLTAIAFRATTGLGSAAVTVTVTVDGNAMSFNLAASGIQVNGGAGTLGTTIGDVVMIPLNLSFLSSLLVSISLSSAGSGVIDANVIRGVKL